MKEKITYEDFLKIFKKDKDEKYLNLIVPETQAHGEMNLIGKRDNELTLDEVIGMKQFAAELFALVDKNTIQ